MRKAVDQDVLKTLLETHAAREFRALRKGSGWALEARLGGYWLPVRSKREPVRRWPSLTALGKFCEGVGIRTLSVEL